jgi:hypothetical protein
MHANGQPSPQQYPPPYSYPQQHQAQFAMQPMVGYAVAPRAPTRNVALLVIGSVTLFFGLLTLLVFAYNAYQYATAEDHFSDIEGAAWVVDLIKEAAMKRMFVFGSASAVLFVGGIVMGALGLRKR